MITQIERMARTVGHEMARARGVSVTQLFDMSAGGQGARIVARRTLRERLPHASESAIRSAVKEMLTP